MPVAAGPLVSLDALVGVLLTGSPPKTRRARFLEPVPDRGCPGPGAGPRTKPCSCSKQGRRYRQPFRQSLAGPGGLAPRRRWGWLCGTSTCTVDDVGAALEAVDRGWSAVPDRGPHFRDQVIATASERGERSRSVVAVAPGHGLAALYEISGASVVLSGVGSKPATRDILRAIERSQAAEVVVLPDDRDVRAVAEAAADQARAGGVRVAVIPTRASVQVLAAVAVHDPGRRFEDDVVAMTAAARATRHGEVTLATKQALTTAGVCHPGDVLGLLEGDIGVIGADVSEVAATLVDRLLAAGGELVTIVTGAEAGDQLGPLLLEHLRRHHPEVETTLYEGGQTHYPLLVGVE